MSVPMPHCENGVCVHFPTADSWQFSNCAAYKAINGGGIKEMDLGWWDAAGNTLWLVELKAFYNPANAMHTPVNLATGTKNADHWIEELYKKSVHSLTMVYSNRKGTQSCLPIALPASHKLKLVHLLRPQPHQKSYLGFIQTNLKTRLAQEAVLFGVDSIVVLDYDAELQTGRIPWITRP